MFHKIWEDPTAKPKVGDILNEKGKDYVISGWDYSRGHVIFRLVDKERPEQKASIDFEGYAMMKGS